MKFAINATELAESLLNVTKACAVRTTTEILEYIKLTAVNDTVTLLAYDGEIAIVDKVKAEILEEGELCVPGKMFSDFIVKLSYKEIVVSTCERGIKIKYDDSISTIQALPADDFPKLSFDIHENSFVMKQNDFKKLVNKTSFCCASDDNRPILKGCLLESEEDYITITALDGYRMAFGREKITSATGNFKIVCPCRALQEIARMLSGEEEEITIYHAGGQMMIAIGNTILLSRLYQGEFINRNSVFPKSFETQVTLKKTEIEEAIARAAVLIRGDKNNLIIMDIKNGEIRITSSSEVGGVDEKVDAYIEGKEIKIAMNSKYIYEAVKAVGESEVELKFNSPVSPFVCVEKENKDYLYLILPVRSAL